MDMRDTLGVLLAGGAGERLFPLTRDRAKPAVPFGGHYRIIDITLSNCINSGLRKVFILTQYKALSLNRHVREGWTGIVAQELGEFFELLPPMQRTGANWYMGTADAVYQNIYSIGSEQPTHMIILSGDHIYKMDYSRMLEYHKETKAEITLATLPVGPDEVSRFGVVEVGSTGEVQGFLEKPASTTFRSPFNPDSVDASMGVYIFNTETLLKALIADAEDPDSKHDFGHNILPNLLGKKKMMAYSFVDENKKQALYWRDVGTLDAYYEANMDLCSVSPIFNLYDRTGPSAPACASTRPPSSYSASPAVQDRPSTPSSPPASLSPALRCPIRSCRRMCASIPIPMSMRASSSRTSTSAAIAGSSGPSSIAMCTSPKERSLATTRWKTSAAILSRPPD